MKKIIHIFIVSQILTSMVYGSLNKEQMDRYWESSRAKYMFQFLKKNLEKDLFTVVSMKKEDAKPVLLNAINTFVNNPKYLKEYKDSFSVIDTSVYVDLNFFYKTSLGKKYRRLSNAIEYNMSQDDVRSKYSEIIENGTITQKKRKLILSIDEELNLLVVKADYERKSIIFTKQILYPEDNITDAMIDRYMTKYWIIAEKYESMLMPVLFNDFTEDELKEILKYASSKILAIEVEYIYKASLQFLMQVRSDIKSNFERLILIRFCQDYTKSSSYIPSSCKKEWISK